MQNSHSLQESTHWWLSYRWATGDSGSIICIGTKLHLPIVHNYIMKSTATHNAACLYWVGCPFSWNAHSWCNAHCETPVCCLDPPQSIRTVAVGTLWSPGALVLHTAPATQQASICDAGTAGSEVGALLHWEPVDLGGECKRTESMIVWKCVKAKFIACIYNDCNN